MKKLLFIALSFVLALTVVACGGNGKDDTQLEGVAKVAAEAATMTTEQLIAKAAEEKGDFAAYGNTSRITKAMTNFIKAYGERLHLTADNAYAAKKSDSEIYTLLTSEFLSSDNSKAASVLLVQDSATLAKYRANTSMLVNYVPGDVAATLSASDVTPLVHQFINKLFIWNNVNGTTPAITNVWQLTEASWSNKIYFKSPANEQVNMNFLAMLTSPEWCTKLAAAYEAHFGTAWVNDGSYENIGYKWVGEFLTNCNFTINSDTTIAGTLSTAENEGNAGLFVLSKFRDSSVTQENLTIGAWQESSVTPFAGFMYSIYAQIAAASPRPYTACLFVNYLMTEEGFAPWCESLGGYSSVPSIPVFTGDKELSFYKDCLVIEDGAYINSVRRQVEEFVTKKIAK